MPESVFCDAHHIERLRRRLWSGQAFGRAAVMVGAGFSRNAERLNSATPVMLDFRSLAAEMWGELNTAPASAAPAGLDPVSVASEYENVYLRQGLNEFLRRQLDDRAYTPAPLHRLLMSLPWADVFTTNWDTLLERAARDVVDRQYALIATPESLVGSQRPRTVKLHGSFPDHTPFIVTKEDFRTYPRTHALFVNTVQQAVMECALCLLGFGGSDPNFLAWSGWVHDHLGDSAPPIYLVGVLDLNTRARTVLERRRVIPIDLAEVFSRKEWPDSGARHQAASEWFLLNLAYGEADPLQWPSLVRRTASAGWNVRPRMPSLLVPLDEQEQQLEQSQSGGLLGQVLRRYPGWLACPPRARSDIEMLVRSERDELDQLLASRERSIALVAWTALARVVNIVRSQLPSKMRDDLGARLQEWEDDSEDWFTLALLYSAELRKAELWKQRESWLDRLFSRKIVSQVRLAELMRERALGAIERLDFDAAVSALNEWPDLPGAFRLQLAKAAALVEVGKVETAFRSVEAVLHSIRVEAVKVEGQLELLALEGSAMTFLRTAELHVTPTREVPSPYARNRELMRWDCEPSELLEHARLELAGEPLKQVGTKKDFEIGRYSITYRSNSPEDELLEKCVSALSLFESLSLPFRCKNSTFFIDVANRAARLIAQSSPAKAFSVIVRGESRDTFDETFDRLLLARLTPDHVSELCDMAKTLMTQIQLAVVQGRATLDETEGRLAIAMELRARIVSRVSESEAEATFRDATSASRLPQFFCSLIFARPTLNGIVQSFKALPEKSRPGLVLQLLELPLPQANSPACGTRSWKDPLPMVAVPSDIEANVRVTWQRAIETCLFAAGSSDPGERWAALARLATLCATKNLSDDQSVRFEHAFWASVDENDPYPALWWSGLSARVPLLLPGAQERKTGERLRAMLIRTCFATEAGPAAKIKDVDERERYYLRALNIVLDEHGPRLSQDESVQLLGESSEWLRTHFEQMSDSAFDQKFRQHAAVAAFTELLGEQILPTILVADGDILAALVTIRGVLAAKQVPTLSWEYHAQRLGVVTREEALSNLFRGMRSGVERELSAAAEGIVTWLRVDADASPDLLFDLVSSLRRPVGSSFSAVVGELASFVHDCPEKLSEDALQRILAVLAALSELTDTTNSENDRLYPDASWMPEARVAATHLAATLWKRFARAREKLEPWAAAASADPILEVRRAWQFAQSD